MSTDPKFAWHALPREDPHKRSVSERLADFLEIYGPFDEQTAREQATRCIQCPDPACVSACPLGNKIPEWLALTAEGHFSEAAAVLHSTSELSDIAARLCPSDRTCEAVCILQGKAEPVSIWAIEQFLDEYALSHHESGEPQAPPNGKRVAVIGAGPGGLTCAEVLSRRGFGVTVYDWRLVPGGLLVSGTPAFRLDRSIVERRIEILRKRGVVFELGVQLGKDFTYSQLRAEFQALFLGFGARKPRELDLPGRNLKGVVQAPLFLAQEHADNIHAGPTVDVAGKRVAVIGGGNMAVDCLRTALRSGAPYVVCVYRRDEGSMTCSHHDYDNAREEGASFVWQASPVEFLGDAEGRVVGLRSQRTELGEPDGSGRRSFRLLAGNEFELKADVVLLALGFEPVPLPDEHPFASLARNERGGLAVDVNQMTSVPGVFAGGDLVRGPTTVLNVVRDARRAAEGIQQHLHGHGR